MKSTHCNDVFKILLGTTVVVLLMAISPTQQEEIRTTWNNRLYPTNSVYASAPPKYESVQQVEQDAEEKEEEDPGAGEVYDDDDDDYADTRDTLSNKEQQQQQQQLAATEEYEYFYDDYDNETFSHETDSHAATRNDDGEILISEAVVSVVTTKSVVNGTFSVPSTPLPMTTEQMLAPPTQPPLPPADETTATTEDTIIVASVQTSRSISGARFLPFNLDKDSNEMNNNKTVAAAAVTESTESIMDKLDQVQSELSSGFLNGGLPAKIKFKIPWPRARPSSSSSSSTTTTTTTTTSTERSRSKDIRAFLPPGFKLDETDVTTEKSLLSEILARSNITKALYPTRTIPIQQSIQELFAKSSVDISGFLPTNFTPATTSSSSSTTTTTTTAKPGGIKLIFPSRPGGRKATSPRLVITAAAAAAAAARPTAIVPKIQKGWATRSTTEFTGWPSPSTTPISIEKLLEAAKTATASSNINSSAVVISTSQVPTTIMTTTTTTTVRPTTPGVCLEECEVAGTIRIIGGNTTWVPELLNRNTKEWQQLANDIETELNLVLQNSAILRKWYKNVRIDAFSPGSILVDYFIELDKLTQRINTQELKVIFHDSLRIYNQTISTTLVTTMRLGKFLIDPKSTDFVIIPKVVQPQPVDKDDKLIPQWAIAVIVIGVGGLVFIIIFGVSVLANRQNNAKLKPVGLAAGIYGEDAAKNIIQSTRLASSTAAHKSEASSIWNDNNSSADAWKEKSFESQHVLVDLPDEKKYNVYDSWRSEWNGHYYQPSHSSSKLATSVARHTPDYDPHF